MTRLNLPIEGECRCGKIRLKISAPPLLTMACHCTGCQRMSGSAYSLSVAIPSEGFEVTQGEPVIAGKSSDAGHHFCADCMTWMFTRPQGMDFFVNVRPTMLDETGWYSPYIETFTTEKLSFAATGAEHSYPAFPPMEDFEGLIAGYAAR